jgi:hypothetical protein
MSVGDVVGAIRNRKLSFLSLCREGIYTERQTFQDVILIIPIEERADLNHMGQSLARTSELKVMEK